MLEPDVAFVLMFHGLRSAATIAVELLKQERRLSCPGEVLLPRSRTIQDLSVFTARLGAVDASHEAFGTCEQGRKMLAAVLDRILSPRDTPMQRSNVQLASPTAVDGSQHVASVASRERRLWRHRSRAINLKP